MPAILLVTALLAFPVTASVRGDPTGDDVIVPGTPGVIVEQTSPNSRRYRIPFSVLLANDDLAELAGLGYSLDLDDPVIVDSTTGSGGNWDEELGSVDTVLFFPSDNCTQAGSCTYFIRIAGGGQVFDFPAQMTVFWPDPTANAFDDARAFQVGAGPFVIDVIANDGGIDGINPGPEHRIEVVAVESGAGNAEVVDVGGFPQLRYRPVSQSPEVAVVRYRLFGCNGSSDTALATYAIGGGVAVVDDFIGVDTPGVIDTGFGYRIPYSALLANDAVAPGQIQKDDPIIVDGATGNGGNWSGNPVTDYVGFSPSESCIPSGDCAYTLRDPQGQPIPGATARIYFTAPLTPTVANPDQGTFANGTGPYRIPVLANDTGFSNQYPLFLGDYVVTSGNGTVEVYYDPLGFEGLQFTPAFEGCGVGTVQYRAQGCFVSNPAVATFTVGPPAVDCNQNCLVDAGEPDGDGDGTPDDCEVATGPCDVKRQVPASLLLFPLFDNRVGNVTLATVTNTNTSFLDGPGGLPAGTVDVEFVYIARYGLGDVELPCLETNHTRRLTPGDTLTLFTGADNPNAELGYFYAFAKSPLTGAAISWNHLVGELLLVSGLEDFEDSVPALAFRSALRERAPTDVDGDGIRDLDGVEYDGAPGELLFPRFLGQDPPGVPGGHASRLVLVALSGGAQFDTLLRVTTFNDNEQPFSDQLEFRCWASLLLTEVSGTFLNEFLANSEQNSPDEFIGEPAREYGWLKLDGAVASSGQDEIHDPAFYAVLFERVGAHGMVSPPWELCSQLNGDLVAQGIFEER